MVAGVQNWQGFPFLKWGGDVSSMNKVWVNAFFSEVFAPRCDETCRCAVLRSYYCTTAHVPYCVGRCSEQCPCLPAHGHPRPISRCLAEDYACPAKWLNTDRIMARSQWRPVQFGAYCTTLDSSHHPPQTNWNLGTFLPV